ncbi:MAG: NAD(P)/FAD-dependent oxidoreductase [Clostridia bacterium]|nr:NAD(P)/FAD-dependent oxidoreductase [Clostridia bacterium]
MHTKIYDVIVIGGGVIGCAAARELSRYALNIAVLERESDVCEGTSKANSAIIHAGFDAVPGTLKARFNVEGSKMMDDIAAELDIPFKRNGALVVCRSEDELQTLRTLYDRGIANGVDGVSIISGDEARSMEPSLSKDVYAALYAPTSGIVCPFEMTLAFAENACKNGVEFYFGSEVTSIERSGSEFVVRTANGEYSTKVVVNCAGVYADDVHNMLEKADFSIKPRKGEYMLLDKSEGGLVSRTIFQVPTQMGKGVLVSPTIHGNLITGPTAADIDDKEDVSTTREGLGSIKSLAAISVDNIPYNKVITSFSGLRATGSTGDFIINDSDGFIDAAGIESPGLTSAPAIGAYISHLVCERLSPETNEKFDPKRRGIPKLAQLDIEQRAALIKDRPDYGHIVCRCEQISEGEILDSIRRPLGAKTLDGVKRRVRAGMGRCQAGFCSPKVIELLAQELGITQQEVKKNG